MANLGSALALVGGVGGAKLALGLARLLPADRLTIIVNTGDDEEFHGLHVSPDLDTVMYTLAGLANPETGWGLSGESFRVLEGLEALGGDVWFRLGDRDLATHLRRTELLRAGWSLSAVTAELCARLGIGPTVAPMSDQSVRTIAVTDEGPLPFQDYFVRRRCEPVVQSLRFEGAETAHPSCAFDRALGSASLLVFGPSNPFVSIDPILAVNGVRARLESFKGPRIAVSPIVAGQAIKGPAAKMLAELGEEVSALAVARRYRGLCDIFVLDSADAALAKAVGELGMQALVTKTVMLTEEDKVTLAKEIVTAAGLADV